ncbi:MAG: cytochrome c peroxidase [Gammaproteobacteria bacterium]
MFDKISSGNFNISRATCHHPPTGTGHGLSLPIGEGGSGLGVTRDTGAGAGAVYERVPRNSPPLFHLGAREFTRLFHDGRVEVDPTKSSGFEHQPGAIFLRGSTMYWRPRPCPGHLGHGDGRSTRRKRHRRCSRCR